MEGRHCCLRLSLEGLGRQGMGRARLVCPRRDEGLDRIQRGDCRPIGFRGLVRCLVRLFHFGCVRGRTQIGSGLASPRQPACGDGGFPPDLASLSSDGGSGEGGFLNSLGGLNFLYLWRPGGEVPEPASGGSGMQIPEIGQQNHSPFRQGLAMLTPGGDGTRGPPPNQGAPRRLAGP